MKGIGPVLSGRKKAERGSGDRTALEIDHEASAAGSASILVE